jgi:hypothetical protein
MSSETEGMRLTVFMSKATAGWSTAVSARRYLECTHGTIGNIGHLSANLIKTDLKYCSKREFLHQFLSADCSEVSALCEHEFRAM